MLDNSIFLYTTIVVIAAILGVLLVFVWPGFPRRRRWLRSSPGDLEPEQAYGQMRRGSLLARRFRIGDEPLGRGMNAVTYQVEDIDNRAGPPLVAKVLLTPREEPRISDESYGRHRERFRQEMINLEKLKEHPYIVPLVGCYPYAMPPFYLMRLCKGSLREQLANVPLPMETILDVVIDVCKGIATMHNNGIIHRDLKPANILRYKGRWVLSDFGMSLLCGEGGVVSVPDSIPGTIPYTAPEVMYCESASFPADIFSFGVTLKQILTGKNIWEVQASSLLEGRIDTATRTEITCFDRLIENMTSLEPERRPEEVQALVRMLYEVFQEINNIRSKASRRNKHRRPPLGRIEELRMTSQSEGM